jgi:hypothetical protein
MSEKLYQRLLEVEIFHLTPTQWEWRVYQGDTLLKTGLAVSRHDAQTDGDTALACSQLMADYFMQVDC